MRQAAVKPTDPNAKDPATQKPVFRPLGSGLVRTWVEDQPSTMALISPDRMRSAGLTEADLDRLGTDNLKQEDIQPLRAAGAKYPGVFSSTGNNYLASVLLDEPFWKRVAGPQADKDLQLCLPARDELYVYVPELDPSATINFADSCRRLAQNAPTFSDRVIHRKGGRWQFQ